MRLLTLNLERYGPFTGRSVAFRKDARLHVVLGANEAGKSSALAAVTDLLFGIEPRTRYAFLHDMPELRIGAEIEARDGRRLCFRRRKGNRNTLVDEADAPLPDDALGPFLHGLTREVFGRAFGLEARTLREGGREMLDIEGEVGASLFAAGSGLRGFTTLQKTLDEEAQTIFAPRRAKDRSFYQALERHDEARKAIRATELREGAWRELNEEIAAAAGRLDAIRRERERIAAERARLERLKRVGPLIASIDAAAERAEADAGLMEADDPWIDRLGERLEALRTASADQARFETALLAARSDLETVATEPGLLERAEDILKEFRGIDRFEKDGTDLPRVQAEASRFSDDLDRLAVRVGLADGGALAARQPSDAQRERVDVLIQEGREIAAALDRAERELAAARAEHEGLGREAAEHGAPIDPAPLRETLKSFAWLRAALSDHAALEGTVRARAAVLRGKAARLSPPVADTAALAAMSLPTAATVARFRAALDESEQARALARQRGEAASRAVAATRERLRRREAGRPIASRADLDALRAKRDTRFAGLREALAIGGRAGLTEIALYERSIFDADRLADEIAADAGRVAEQAADRDRLGAEEDEAKAADRALAEIEAGLADGRSAWAALWQPVALAPGRPAEMASWLDAVEKLTEEQDDIDQGRTDLRFRAERIAGIVVPLAELGRDAGLSGLERPDAGLLLARVEERIAALGQRWEATREADARIRAAAAGIARHERAREAAQARQAAWRAEWASALPAVGLAAAARMEEAAGALAAWREVPAILRQRSDAERRVSGIKRDRDDYRANVVRLAELAADLDASAPTAAIRTLQKRLQAAQASETRREELAKRLAEAERRVGAARRSADDMQAALERHLAETSPESATPAFPEIEALHRRLVARRTLRAERAARRAELLRAADGVTEAALRVDLAATSADAIEAEVAQLAAEQEANDRSGQVAYADRVRHEQRRSELEGGTGAELAHAEKKAAEAEIAARAREWAVLKLATLMLGTAIGRHRAGQQDPLLTRAGEIFSALTGGGFSALAQDYGAADEPRIVGRRASGAIVSVEGMSEGTRDQLYLALRLAYLQDFATRAEAAPFIGDDLFSTFDDARTGHGLEALAAIGESLQPILFTHHRHVADLAAARLGERADIIAL